MICFDGLDTYADVILNGVKILSTDNMFRRWSVDVKKLLGEKENELEVYFHSPVKDGICCRSIVYFLRCVNIL